MKKTVASIALLAAACAAPPLGPPDQVAQEISLAIEEGDTEGARRLFDRAQSSGYAERIYPVLYGRAGGYYGEGDAASAAHLLRFMHAHYPESDAVTEALLYSLFLERASQAGEPASNESAAGAELDELLREVQSRDATPSIWVDLIRTQRAIDRGQPEQAREPYARFRAAWDTRPAELAVYVDDLGRHLSGAGGLPGERP